MQNKIQAIQKLLPEAVEQFKVRYELLQVVMQKQPIGRRGLTTLVNLSERMVRGEIDKLAQNGLVTIDSHGISITQLGKDILNVLYMTLHYFESQPRQEEEIREFLELKKVMILKGNLEDEEDSKVELGFAINSLFESLLMPDMTVAITGGTTMANMVNYIPFKEGRYNNIHVIPARGSVGKRVELHATTIAAALATKLGGVYDVLAVPDNLSHRSISLIKNEPQMENILKKLQKTDIIIFGIGNALKMAKHRKESEEILSILEENNAVAEVFRHYFNAKGEVVYANEVIGVSPSMAENIPIKIAIAGGKSKAKAILATKSILKGGYLIIDEEAAESILCEIKS